MKTVVVRSISGLLFIALMLAGLLINGHLFSLLLAVMTFGMISELIKVPGFARQKPGVLYYIVGTVYILMAMALLIVLAYAGGDFSGKLPLCFFILIWCSDVGAYCIGSTIGKKTGSKKMAPTISPNKSWAGFWGGMAFALIGAFVLARTSMLEFPIWAALVLGLLIHCSGVVGDLIESAWKRHFGVKDSGSIMPGHGGFLDRFDSSLLAIPFGTLFLAAINLI